MNSLEYLVKSAVPNPMRFAMERPFSDRTPQQMASDGPQILQNLYRGLPSGSKRIVDARMRGKSHFSSNAFGSL